MVRFVLKFDKFGLTKYLHHTTKIPDAKVANTVDIPKEALKFIDRDTARKYKIEELGCLTDDWKIVKIVHCIDKEDMNAWKEVEESETPTPTQENPMVAPFKSETEDDRPKYEEGTPLWVIGGAHNKDMLFQRRYDENAALDGGSSGKPYSEAYQFTPNVADACLYFGEQIPKSCFQMGRKIAWKHKEFHNLPETEVRFYHGEIKEGIPVLDPCLAIHYYNTKEDHPHMKNRFPEPEKPAETDMMAVFNKIEEFAKTLGVSLQAVQHHLIMQTVEDMAKDLGVSLFEYTETNDKANSSECIEFLRNLFKRSIEGNKAATAMAEKEGHPVTVLGRFITARKAMQLLNQKIPEYARLSKNLNAGQPSEAEVDEAVKGLRRKLGIQL
jgi:hypothetical protein